MANVLAPVAQETEVRAERIVAGQAVARAKEVKFGRPQRTGKRIKVTPDDPPVEIRGQAGRCHRPRRRVEPAHDLSRPRPGRALSGRAKGEQ